MIEFTPFPKLARLNRNVIITEKIDGTNAAVVITDDGMVYAQSRTRLITPEQDNHGFARWVHDNAPELIEGLGPGVHFGEWWGSGIQRGYDLPKGEKRFSLFNTGRWKSEFNANATFWWLKYDDNLSTVCSECSVCHVVPVLDNWGKFDSTRVALWIAELRSRGSAASPGFMRPEGVVLFHTAANTMFKVTLDKDEVPKFLALKAVEEAERAA